MPPDNDPSINKVATGKAYIYRRATNQTTGQSYQTKIMIDQGNLIQSGIAISEDFFKRMKLQYSKIIRNGRCTTAGKGLGMTKLGISEDFSLRINGIHTVFDTKATIIRQLTDDINLGTVSCNRPPLRG